MSIKNNYPSTRPSLSLDFANTKTLDPRITFARATTAKYYDGKTVAKAEQNLLTYSQEFEPGPPWFRSEALVTANTTTAPDGTTTADSLIESTTNSVHKIYQQTAVVVTGQSYVGSVFAKTSGRNVLVRSLFGGGIGGAKYDLTNGTVISFDSGVTASISNAGNGWYRLIYSFIATSSGTPQFALELLSGSSDTYTGDGTSGIFLWGAQLEQRSTVTAYTPTTTQPITNYIPTLLTADANTARFDHNPVTGESLGLLVEEQRTNLVLQSQIATGWTAFRAQLNTNTIVSPIGTVTGSGINATDVSNTHAVQSAGISISNASTYTATVYGKAGSFDWLYIDLYDGTFPYAYFNVRTGVLGNKGATVSASTITNVGNGWYRCSLTYTSGGTTGYVRIITAQENGGAEPNTTGDGFSNNIYIWGAQLEAGAFPTSYIPTVASQVTRSADSASMTGTNFSSWYNPAQGTFAFDIGSGGGNGLWNGQFPYDTAMGAVGINRNDRQFSLSHSGGRPVINKTGGTPSQFIFPSYLNLNGAFPPLKVAMSFNQTTGLAITANGATPSATSWTSQPSGPSPIQFYINPALNWHIKKVAYYPISLTTTNLQALTGS